MRENTVIKMSVQRMVCTGCGSEANASCNCGVAYVPKAQRTREAVADPANKHKSNVLLAEELGVDEKQVRRARSDMSDPDDPDERVGRDGKSYPAKLRLVDDGDEFNERLAYAQTKNAFIARAAEAEADAMYIGKVDEEVILAAEETAAAWCQLVSTLKGKC